MKLLNCFCGWLETEPKFSFKLLFQYVFGTVFIMVMYIGTLAVIIRGKPIFPEITSGLTALMPLPELLKEFRNVFEEEMFFRLLPTLIIFLIFKPELMIGARVYTKTVIFVNVLSALMFTFGHDISVLLVQGVLGFSLSVLFLKFGGLKGRWAFAPALTASTLAHFFYNIAVWRVLL